MMPSSRTMSARLFNIAVSIVLYAYFVFAFLLVFVWFYLGCRLLSRDVEASFQRLSNAFYKGFFSLAEAMMPRLEIRIEEGVRTIRSSIVISNHLSYLDPILLISLFAKHKTIVKGRFFRYPIFSWVLKGSGYIPSGAGRRHVDLMIRNMETLPDFLKSGGNLFIFPEGTRGCDGGLGHFEKGAFTIARNCRAPIRVLRITGSHRLFPPGRLVFNADEKVLIKVECIGTISPETIRDAGSLGDVIKTARSCYQAKEAETHDRAAAACDSSVHSCLDRLDPP